MCPGKAALITNLHKAPHVITNPETGKEEKVTVEGRVIEIERKKERKGEGKASWKITGEVGLFKFEEGRKELEE